MAKVRLSLSGLRLLCAVLLTAFGFSLFGCRSEAADGDVVHIRLVNRSDSTISRAWLGAGEQQGATATTGFRRIRPNSASDYIAIERVAANYSFADLRVDGEMMLSRNIDPSAALGTPMQRGHYYSFVFAESDGRVQLVDIIEDMVADE